MNFQSWYTDTVDVFRVRAVTEHGLTRHERTQVLSAVPCRVYRSDSRALQTEQTAAYVRQEDHLMLDNAVDIRAGDELHIRRGALLGKEAEELRAFAPEPNRYFEPFGAVLPGLAHQEIRLLQQERVK